MVDVLVGGMLAIAGGLVAVLASGYTERQRSRREEQLRASVRLLTSLQTHLRRMLDIAYLAKDPGVEYLSASESEDLRNAVSRYRDATVEWNAAMYEVMLVSPPSLAARLQPIDRETDRLLALARARQWNRSDFRAERINIGRMAADYVRAVRAEAGLKAVALESVWAWDDDQLDARD